MSQTTDLRQRRCQPCEGGVPPLPPEKVHALLAEVPGWALTADGKRIRREWRVKDFAAGLDFFRRVGELAEAEGHHPDLYLAWGKCKVRSGRTRSTA